MSERTPAEPVEREGAAAPSRFRRPRMTSIATLALVAVTLLLFGLRGLAGDGGPKGPGLVYDIPLGASNTVPAGLKSAVAMPTDIVFAKGETAKITVTNNDTVTHLAGPFLVGPGQTFVQTFPSPGRYPITCTVNEDESIVVTVQ
jgi:hypothetical protein